MKAFFAFWKKELLEQLRSGRLVILGALFVLFGIMNPLVAKLTPVLLDLLSDSLVQSGMSITVPEVTAMDSWVQFFKNIPMALIVFVLMQGAIFTREYASGTLVLSLTKGLKRRWVLSAKAAVLSLLWTAGYWMCFGITWLYNAYYWDNSVAQSLLFSALCWWVFGMFVVSLMVFFSALCRNNTGVLLGTGAVSFLPQLLGMLPKVGRYLPTFLTDGTSLIYGLSDPEGYLASLGITAVASVLLFAVSIPVFNKKQL